MKEGIGQGRKRRSESTAYQLSDGVKMEKDTEREEERMECRKEYILT
jgi:hypothetical protein